jgi:hypothetical protein
LALPTCLCGRHAGNRQASESYQVAGGGTGCPCAVRKGRRRVGTPAAVKAGCAVQLPTFMRWSTLASSCAFTPSRQYMLLPGLE